MDRKELLIQCCACRRVKRERTWTDEAPEIRPTYSHGYCPVCLRRAMLEVAAWSNRPRAQAVTATCIGPGAV